MGSLTLPITIEFFHLIVNLLNKKGMIIKNGKNEGVKDI